MDKDLTVNGESNMPSVSRRADYVADHEKMDILQFREDVIDLIESGKMENWNLAAFMLGLASISCHDIPSQYTLEQKYQEEKYAKVFPGETLEDFKKLLNEDDIEEATGSYPYLLKTVRDESHLKNWYDVPERVLMSIYSKLRWEYDADVQKYAKDFPQETITVDYS
jgi:hypothetical protein